MPIAGRVEPTQEFKQKILEIREIVAGLLLWERMLCQELIDCIFIHNNQDLSQDLLCEKYPMIHAIVVAIQTEHAGELLNVGGQEFELYDTSQFYLSPVVPVHVHVPVANSVSIHNHIADLKSLVVSQDYSIPVRKYVSYAMVNVMDELMFGEVCQHIMSRHVEILASGFSGVGVPFKSFVLNYGHAFLEEGHIEQCEHLYDHFKDVMLPQL